MSPDDSARRPQAIAITYDEHSAAPRVVAKGYGTLAETIIKTAKSHGLYVHESPELVNLLMQVELDQQIPPELYVAIAELLAWLYQIEGNAAGTPLQAMGLPITPPDTGRSGP